MNFDINIVIYITISLLVLIVLFVINQRKSTKNEKRVQELTQDIEKLKRNIFDKDISISSYENVKQTSLIMAEIKKRETLEDEITRLKRIVQDTKVIAQDASMVKTDFLTNIRHEIRTPMNSILVFSEMLEKAIHDKQLSMYASNIFNSGHNLLNLLNNVIELSEIEAGSFEVTTSAIDIHSFMSGELDKHKAQADKKSLNLVLSISDDMSESVMFDKKKVQEILENLLSNAIKFTKHGEIKMSVTQDSFNDSKNEADISICVEDSGIGIADENKEKIFKIFESRHSSNTIHYEGTGLGLSINRKLARLMDGDIQVSSVLSVGSKFTLILNNVEVVLVSITKEVEEKDINFSLIKKSKILVIDDKEDSLEIIKHSFENSPSDVYTFNNARDAIGFLKNIEIDLLLINIDILTMDDGAVSKVLAKYISAPVISLVNSRLRDINFHKSGIQPIEHIKKPLKKIDLFRVLLKVLNSQELDFKEVGSLKIKEVPLALSFERNKLASIKYFKGQSKEIDKLLYEALSTNDLNTIENFAGLIEAESRKFKVVTLEAFSKRLLSSIEAFDIEEVDKMLNEYTSKSRDFRRGYPLI